ncbi:tripartite tricarboxylate transporter substrate binding protein [Polaromonas sp. C04]|uniref:Bug family tripartite tricarboxylate transporter substrate binding protein n=1 Tax=Polaromonas sp. C04 TaxID=1945857 RepID=UPI0011867900|nr:tripartite tricarboxylate transporter substrate binding protein [Polaromonas sp. C04]
MSMHRPLTRRQSIAAASALLLTLGQGATQALAEGAYPGKTVTFVNCWPPGGPSDILARSVASVLDTTLKQSFVVENKPGAAGNIGSDYVAKSQPDGYTVLFGIGTTYTVNPHLYKKMPFKPGDLKPVMILATSGLLVGVNPSTRIKTMSELVARAKTKTLNFSSGGNGSPGHLEVALLNELTQTRLNHIPYKGNSPAVSAVVSGEVDGGVLATPGMLPFVKAGKITALAVTSRQRSTLAPDIPTVAEAGYKELLQEVLYVAMVPAATPEPVMQILQRAFADALARPDVQKRMAILDLQFDGSTGAAAVKRLTEDSDRFGHIIQATGMKID